MAKRAAKLDFPVSNIRRLHEPGPIVLVSSQFGGERTIMPMVWPTRIEFTPALVG